MGKVMFSGGAWYVDGRRKGEGTVRFGERGPKPEHRVTGEQGAWWVRGPLAGSGSEGPYRTRAEAREQARRLEAELAARAQDGPRTGDTDPDGGVL